MWLFSYEIPWNWRATYRFIGTLIVHVQSVLFRSTSGYPGLVNIPPKLYNSPPHPGPDIERTLKEWITMIVVKTCFLTLCTYPYSRPSMWYHRDRCHNMTMEFPWISTAGGSWLWIKVLVHFLRSMIESIHYYDHCTPEKRWKNICFFSLVQHKIPKCHTFRGILSSVHAVEVWYSNAVKYSVIV